MPGLDEARTRPGTGPAVFHASARKEDPPPGNSGLVEKRGTTTRRNPMFLLRLFGLFLLRYAQRTFLALLLNDPPRTTRWPAGRPPHKGQPSRSPYVPRVSVVCLIHPPNSRPISATIPAAWRYWPGVSQFQRAARRR